MDQRISYEGLIACRDRGSSRFRSLLENLEEEKTVFPKLFRKLRGPLHGIDHWLRVAIQGLAIARALRGGGRVAAPCLLEPEGLEEALVLAAFFHDSARTTDGTEAGHGKEAEKVWRHFAGRKILPRDLQEHVSEAILFHEDHRSVDPAAREVTICLCNADRLDRVRLGEKIDPRRMYDDGIWRSLEPFSGRLLEELSPAKVLSEMGLTE